MCSRGNWHRLHSEFASKRRVVHDVNVVYDLTEEPLSARLPHTKLRKNIPALILGGVHLADRPQTCTPVLPRYTASVPSEAAESAGICRT